MKWTILTWFLRYSMTNFKFNTVSTKQSSDIKVYLNSVGTMYCNNWLLYDKRQRYHLLYQGPFTNCVYKWRGVGGQKNWLLVNSCKLLYHIKCKRGGVGGRKETHLVNVVFKRPLTNSSTEGWARVKIHSCDLPHQRFFLHKDWFETNALFKWLWAT